MPDSDRLVFASTVEALLIRGLGARLGPGTREGLRALGIDLDRRLLPGYSTTLWNRAVKLVGRELYPELTPGEAQYQLGQRTVLGLEETLVGKAMIALARVVGPRKSMLRLPHSSKNGSNYSGLESREVSPTHVEVTARQFDSEPEFLVGALMATLAISGAREPKVEVTSWDPQLELLVLQVRWSA